MAALALVAALWWFSPHAADQPSCVGSLEAIAAGGNGVPGANVPR